ncbi:MAG: hypothetical protein JZD41_09235 [Thermoproteus sp.]|nr:hypothetical protein [Thermoproteus sp.]
MNALIRALEAKLSAQRRLESLLSREEARAAGRDHHARRRELCPLFIIIFFFIIHLLYLHLH